MIHDAIIFLVGAMTGVAGVLTLLSYELDLATRGEDE